MRVIELFVIKEAPLRTGKGGNRHITHLLAGPQDEADWSWPKTISGIVGPDVEMETAEHGVIVAMGVERYLAPWATVQSVRFEDVAPPMVAGVLPVPVSRQVRPPLVPDAVKVERSLALEQASAPPLATPPWSPKGGKRR